MDMIFGLIKGVPWYLWAIAVVLAWGGWQRHVATSSANRLREEQLLIAKQREETLAKTVAETKRRLGEQKRISDETGSKLATATASAAAAGAAADRLRAHLTSAYPGSAGPAKAGEASVLAGVLSECTGRYQSVAAAADAAIVAGQSCEKAYDSLTQ